MPSFLASYTSPTDASTSSLAGSPSTFRATIIAYARSILPSSLPASFYDYVPFMLAGLMALLFTALLVLLVEDSEDVYVHSPRTARTESSQKLKVNKKRLVGLAEQDSNAERGDDDWDDNSYNQAWNPRADMDSSRSSTNLKISQDWVRVQNEKMADSGYRYRTTSRRLLASPPQSAPPQSQGFTPPMLSMAKLIMHRHDQTSKRARTASSRPSPPPSPPATASGLGSFGPMQYTLKSAREIKASFSIDGPSSSASASSLPPSPTSPRFSSVLASSPPLSRTSFSAPTSPIASSTPIIPMQSISSQQPSRHARSRVYSDSFASFQTSLVPALQKLQKQQAQGSERSLRRRPSGMLEEGVDRQLPSTSAPTSPQLPAEKSPTSPPSPSSQKKSKRSRKRSNSSAKSKAAAVAAAVAQSTSLAALEEGAHRSR